MSNEGPDLYYLILKQSFNIVETSIWTPKSIYGIQKVYPYSFSVPELDISQLKGRMQLI